MAFKLKLDSEGKVALGSNGQPVFIDDEKGDEEFTFSQVQENWGQRLASVSGEAGGYRKEKAALKKELDKWASWKRTLMRSATWLRSLTRLISAR